MLHKYLEFFRVEDEDICVEDKIPDESEAFIFSNMKEKIQKS